MIQYCRAIAAAWILGVLPLLDASPAVAQFSRGPFELSGSVTLDEVDSSVRTQLERVKAYVADGQWDEAVEALRRLMESDGAKMIAITPRRYVNLADFCHVQIASLPSEVTSLRSKTYVSLPLPPSNESSPPRPSNVLSRALPVSESS